MKEHRAPPGGRSSDMFVRRVTGEISPAQYVRSIDDRLAARRKSEEQAPRRDKKAERTRRAA